MSESGDQEHLTTAEPAQRQLARWAFGGPISPQDYAAVRSAWAERGLLVDDSDDEPLFGCSTPTVAAASNCHRPMPGVGAALRARQRRADHRVAILGRRRSHHGLSQSPLGAPTCVRTSLRDGVSSCVLWWFLDGRVRLKMMLEPGGATAERAGELRVRMARRPELDIQPTASVPVEVVTPG